MKDKREAELRKKIIVYFVNCTFVIFVVGELFFLLVEPFIEELKTDSPSVLAVVISLVAVVVSAAIYFAGAYVFYRLTKKALREESERRVNEQNMIYAAIVHDLKTPMTSVQGFAKALAEGRIRPEEQQEIYDIIHRKSDSMNELVNTLFSYAKLGTEEYPLNLQPLDLCTLVRDIAAENYCDLEEHGIEPEIEIPDTPIMISADKTELKRAVTNLVVNTYKHNPCDIRVLIRVTSNGQNAYISIADTGEVIPPEMDIFEPFVTENSSRISGRGSGLGLSITKRIIERHGGSITVGPTFNGYTKEFTVTLKI